MPLGSSPARSRTTIWLFGANLINAKFRSVAWAVKKRNPVTPLLSDLDSSRETLLAPNAGAASPSVAVAETRVAINRRNLCTDSTLLAKPAPGQPMTSPAAGRRAPSVRSRHVRRRHAPPVGLDGGGDDPAVAEGRRRPGEPRRRARRDRDRQGHHDVRGRPGGRAQD